MAAPERWRAAGRALAAAALLACLVPSQAQQPAATARLQACAACHGPNGNSQVPTIPSLAGQPRVFIENQLVLIREGLRDIPQMRGLLDGVKDAELVTMAQYFAAQTPVRAAGAPVNAEMFQRGQQLASKTLCGTCHLPDYVGREQMPRLAGQQEQFLLLSMKQFRDHAGPGRDTIMSAALYGIKDNELADLAHYLANFK